MVPADRGGGLRPPAQPGHRGAQPRWPVNLAATLGHHSRNHTDRSPSSASGSDATDNTQEPRSPGYSRVGSAPVSCRPHPTYPVQLCNPGIMNLESRLSLGPAQGEYELLDFNPRVGAPVPGLRRRRQRRRGARSASRPYRAGGAPPTAERRPGVYGGAERSACQSRIPPRRRPEPALMAVLAAGNWPGSPAKIWLRSSCSGRPARTPTSARPFEQRFDTKVHAGEATATTTVKARSRPDSMHGSGPAHGR
jgi:hypothetical protein